MSQGWDVLEAAVGEGSAVVALGRGQPAQNLAQSVVVVVLREAIQGSFSRGQAGEALPIQDFGLQDVPEGFDLAVLPFVQGEVIWVRRCRMRSSAKRLPKLERRPGIQPTKGLPLSLISCRAARRARSTRLASARWARPWLP